MNKEEAKTMADKLDTTMTEALAHATDDKINEVALGLEAQATCFHRLKTTPPDERFPVMEEYTRIKLATDLKVVELFGLAVDMGLDSMSSAGGAVRDAKTGEPLAGLTMGFLAPDDPDEVAYVLAVSRLAVAKGTFVAGPVPLYDHLADHTVSAKDGYVVVRLLHNKDGTTEAEVLAERRNGLWVDIDPPEPLETMS